MTETDVELQLAEWFLKHNMTIYHNHKTQYFYKTFTTKGRKEKPDLLVYMNSYPVKGYIAIEVKDATSNKNIYDATKIIDYLNHYKNKETIYLINGKEINVHAFAVATQYSHIGKLFTDEKIVMPSQNDKWHERLQTYQNEPPKEYDKSKQYLRQMWATWRRTRTDTDPALGIILSSQLIKESTDYPFLFYQIRYQPFASQKERWCVRWTQI